LHSTAINHIINQKTGEKKNPEAEQMVSEETIQEAARRLVEKFRPARIILFGSYARGTADDHSDLDFIPGLQKDRFPLYPQHLPPAGDASP